MSNLAQRIIKSVYSGAADRLYEPIVVRRAFPLLGGDLESLVLEQGRRAVGTAGDRPILDMPVGTAYYTVRTALAHDGLTVGSDIAWGMVRRAAERDAKGLVPVQSDAHRLPFGDGAFGAILCHNGLQVIPGLTGAVRELARVLAPGGILYLSVVAAPVGAFLPRRAARHLPTVLRSGRDVALELESANLAVTSFERNRLAYLMEAVKRRN